MEALARFVGLLPFAGLVLCAVFTVAAGVELAAGRCRKGNRKALPAMPVKAAGSFLLSDMLILFLSRILMERGILNMDDYGMIGQIAMMMHWTACAYAGASVLLVLCCIVSAYKHQETVTVLKQLMVRCILISILFWAITWFIV